MFPSGYFTRQVDTVVECHYRGGMVQSLSVTPEARKEDVEFLI